MLAGLVLCLCLTGCNVTMSGNARWSEPAPVQPAPDAQLQQQHQQLATAVNKLTAELKAAPNDIETVNAILRKYGIERPMEDNE